MKYIVTYATTDDTIGNPFWHSFILLSTIDDDTNTVNIVDNWGYYGVPSTSRNGLISDIKIKIGLDIDLTGNHGLLRHEELRFLDLGKGLHGISFELTENQFKTLQEKCLAQDKQQKDAINYYSKDIVGKSPKNTRLYPQENYSREIYALETARASDKGESPRLKPFEIRWNWTLWGPSVSDSYTCKSMAIELLSCVLPQEHIDRLTEYGKHPTVPKYSGKLERIYLHSSGQLRQHTKRSGDVVNYRSFDDNDVKLQWTLPPQEFIALSDDTKSLLEINPYYVEDAKDVIGKLQQLEWLFINANIDNQYEQYRHNLIQRIRDCYLSFAKQSEQDSKSVTDSSIESFFLNLLHLPRTNQEQVFFNKINQAKSFLNMLYMFMVDGERIDLDLPSELEVLEGDSDSLQYNLLEFLACHLTTQDQQRLCSIIGRTYVEPEYNQDDEEEFQSLSMSH